MNNRTKYARSGFTLLELLVAASILSVVSTIATVGFFKLTNQWGTILSKQHTEDVAHNAFTSFHSDIERVVPFELFEVPLEGQASNVEDQRKFWRIMLENDKIELPIEEVDPATGQRSLQVIRYEIDRSEETPWLVRYVIAEGTNGARSLKISKAFPGILGMRISYFDGQLWKNQWTDTHLPSAIRFSITLVDDIRLTTQIARVTTFRVRVT